MNESECIEMCTSFLSSAVSCIDSKCRNCNFSSIVYCVLLSFPWLGVYSIWLLEIVVAYNDDASDDHNKEIEYDSW